MDLKEIHLSGFKSFADKTVIRFEEGVTCIVGPNGCGKSNIADAVRWVLGEKSAKNLRGTNMQDVIFGGTVERKQSSFSEVTLVFDNTKRIFDIDVDLQHAVVLVKTAFGREGIVHNERLIVVVSAADCDIILADVDIFERKHVATVYDELEVHQAHVRFQGLSALP